MDIKCLCCKKRTTRNQFEFRNRREVTDNNQQLKNRLCKMMKVHHLPDGYVCNRCRVKLRKTEQPGEDSVWCWVDELTNEMKPDEQQLLPPTEQANSVVVKVDMPNIKTYPLSHNICYVCRATVTKGCRKIPSKARVQLLVLHGFLAPVGSRVCITHLHGDNIVNDLEMSPGARHGSNATMDMDDITGLFEEMLDNLKEAYQLPALNFNNMDDSEYLLWTGWSRLQFDQMLPYLKYVNDTELRNKRNALGMFWLKVKTDLSYKQLASLVGLKSRQTFSLIMESVRNSLKKYFVPLYLYPGHLSRETAQSHSTIFSRTFFGSDNVAVIWDGTYFYTHKSEHHETNRSTYSGQKHRHLVKMMSLILPDGYVLDITGPYPSDGYHNDAALASHVLKSHNGLKEFLQDEDVQILDRGF